MNAWTVYCLVTIGAAAALGVVSRLVWLAGLYRALRNSRPKDRPDILRAYASALPNQKPGTVPSDDEITREHVTMGKIREME